MSKEKTLTEELLHLIPGRPMTHVKARAYGHRHLVCEGDLIGQPITAYEGCEMVRLWKAGFKGTICQCIDQAIENCMRARLS